MTKQEQAQIRALGQCRFGHRAFDKRFIRDLASHIRRGEAKPLTNNQRYTLAKIIYRYRRQLQGKLPEELQLTTLPEPSDYGLDDSLALVDDMFGADPSPPHPQGRLEY